MLNKLTIKNIALIAKAEIDFTQKLNVMSGETGSGKSVILESINFVLGAKTDKNLIKHGETDCFVSAEFDVSKNLSIKNVLEELDIDFDDILILSRKVTIDGKNTIKVNGVSVNLSMLKKITSKLVDVHGQSEHYNLLSEVNQLKLIDNFGGNTINEIKDEISKIYTEYKKIVDFLSDAGGDERQREIKLDVLNYQINEIEKAEIYETEEEELNDIKSKLINQEKILSSLRGSKSCISEEGGVQDVLYNAIKLLSSITDLNEEYAQLYTRIQNAYTEISDIESEITSCVDNFNTYEVSLDDVISRLDVIKNLQRKYGSNYEEIINFLDNAIKERDNLLKYEETYNDYLIKKDKLARSLYDNYKKLNEERKKIADMFSNNVVLELKQLGMNNAQFNVKFFDFPSYEDCTFTKTGPDRIEFLFSANLGEAVKPLSSVISGGEISRFMLAIKVQSSAFNDVSTYIFDEIDAGISGVTANVVAQKLSNISKNTQVIAISHLPQISVYADNNILIEKHELDGKTTTLITKLNEENKIKELIRLVGGSSSSDSARKLVLELIDNANKHKNKK